MYVAIFQIPVLFVGKKVLIPLESMRKMEASIANMPEHLICASLVNQELIVKEEPLEKIESVVKPFIEKEIVFNYVSD